MKYRWTSLLLNDQRVLSNNSRDYSHALHFYSFGPLTSALVHAKIRRRLVIIKPAAIDSETKKENFVRSHFNNLEGTTFLWIYINVSIKFHILWNNNINFSRWRMHMYPNNISFYFYLLAYSSLTERPCLIFNCGLEVGTGFDADKWQSLRRRSNFRIDWYAVCCLTLF